MIARVSTFAVDGVTSRRVWVEADIRSKGLPAFTVVGLADKAVREARERVRAALQNSGFVFPGGRITVNLAPADLRKIGPGFDLPLALALLVAGGELEADELAGCAVIGELALNGELRAVRGTLAIAEGARRHGLRRIAAHWLSEPLDRPWHEELRFDAIGVLVDRDDGLVRLDHIENAF